MTVWVSTIWMNPYDTLNACKYPSYSFVYYVLEADRLYQIQEVGLHVF